MHDPKYKPDQWVLYDNPDSLTGFGKVTGGDYSDGWIYTVVGADHNRQIAEDDVISILENGNWTKPQHFGGADSAYADNAAG